MKTVRNFICCLVVALAMLIPTASFAEESETNCDSVPWTYWTVRCERIAAEIDAFEDYFNESIIDGTFFTMEVFATLFAQDADTVFVLPDLEKVEARGIDEHFANIMQYSHLNFVDVVSNAPRRIHVIDSRNAVLMRDTILVTDEGIGFDTKITQTLHKQRRWRGGNWLVESSSQVLTPVETPPSP